MSWCIGHLAGLSSAESYDPKYAKWRYEDLPILPKHWQSTVGERQEKQFETLKKLMADPEVTEVVNACDAGREGEADFPHGLLPGGLPEAHETAVDFQHGGFRHPGGFAKPAPRRGL